MSEQAKGGEQIEWPVKWTEDGFVTDEQRRVEISFRQRHGSYVDRQAFGQFIADALNEKHQRLTHGEG